MTDESSGQVIAFVVVHAYTPCQFLRAILSILGAWRRQGAIHDIHVVAYSTAPVAALAKWVATHSSQDASVLVCSPLVGIPSQLDWNLWCEQWNACTTSMWQTQDGALVAGRASSVFAALKACSKTGQGDLSHAWTLARSNGQMTIGPDGWTHVNDTRLDVSSIVFKGPFGSLQAAMGHIITRDREMFWPWFTAGWTWPIT